MDVLEPLPFCYYWRHRGFWKSKSELYLPEGVHLNNLGNYKFMHSIRGAVLQALKLVGASTVQSMLCPVVASSIFKGRCYNTFMRCCVTSTFTTLQAISYVIMHFKCFLVACFVLGIYGYFGVLLSWRLLFTTLVCPTHSSHYRTNVPFTMSRIIFCHYVACS